MAGIRRAAVIFSTDDLCPATGVFGRNISYENAPVANSFFATGAFGGSAFRSALFGQREQEFESPFFPVFGRDASFVVQYRVADDRQSESRSSVFATPTFVDPVETDEYFFQIGLRYAAAVVVEREVVEIVVLGVLLDRDRDAFAGVIDRIVGQVPEDRVKQRVVSFDRRSAADAVDDLHAVSVQRIFMVGDHLFDDLFQVDRFALEQVGRLFDLGDQRDVADQVGQSQCLGISPVEKEALFVRTDLVLLQQGFEVSPDAGDGGFQFVRDVVGHLLFQQPVFLLRGDVIERDFETVVVENQQPDGEMTAFPGKLGFVDRDRGRLRVDRPVPLQEFAQVAEIFGPENCGRVGGRFVEDEDLRLVQQRLGDADAPLHAAGELGDAFFAHVRQSQLFQQIVGAASRVAFADALERSHVVEIIAHGEARIEAKFLRQIAEAVAIRRADTIDRNPVGADFASRRLHDAAAHAHERRFASAVGAQEPPNARREREGNIVDSAFVFEAFTNAVNGQFHKNLLSSGKLQLAEMI